MAQSKLLVHAADNANGIVHHITPASAGWRFVGFELRKLRHGERSSLETEKTEACVVVMSGRTRLTTNAFDSGPIGDRKNVFEALPWSVYLPPHDTASIEALSDCEIAVC
jgi:5-deoxy-glucuronate isomerase